MHRLFALLATATIAGCTDPRGAIKALDDAGMKDGHVEGYAWFLCDKNDTFHTKFTATNSNGKPVSGAVCSGWFKGSTIRFD